MDNSLCQTPYPNASLTPPATMNGKRQRSCAFFLRVFLALVGATNAPLSLGADYNLGPGDVITITVYDYPELLTETRVSDTGAISFPLIGEVKVAGKTPADAEKIITKALVGGGYIKQPQVHVKVLQFVSQQVSVIGEVKTPGKYPLQEASHVSDVIALAGGVSPESGGDKAFVIRKDEPSKKIEIDLYGLVRGEQSQNLEVSGGDIVYIPRRAQFYIYGEVQHPGTYRLERNMTVQQAVSVGGGLTPKGTERGMEIRRKLANGEQEVIEVEGKDLLQSDDVLFVDESLF
jgi:polysaccharide export outer membrane protein